MKAVFKSAKPYADDALNLPVHNVESAIPYYERAFGFQLLSRDATPHARAILARDDVQIGLAENGGDPTQDGCFFEVDDVNAAHAELTQRSAAPGAIKLARANGRQYHAFFVIAPDGLCFMIAQPAD